MRNAQKKIARPILLWHDDAGVGAGVLWVIHNPPRLVVLSVVQELKNEHEGKVVRGRGEKEKV